MNAQNEPASMNTVVVVAGGPTPSKISLALLPANAVAVIAADSGLDNALALGLQPTLVVGDMDSASAEGLAWAQRNDVPQQVVDEDKDLTDLELALDLAARGADRIVVVDSGQGRPDHALANLLLLASPVYKGVEITGLVGSAVVSVVWTNRQLHGAAGSIVTLLPIHGEVAGVTTTGLQWPLHDATLHPGRTRGVSNIMVTDNAEVAVTAGVLLAIQPRSGQ